VPQWKKITGEVKAAMPRSLFPDSPQMIKSSGAQMCVLSYERMLMRTQLLSPNHNGWWNLDLRLLSKNKATITTVEQPTITKSKRGAAGLQFNKEYVHINSGFWDAWEKMCNETDHNFGTTTTGSFIMTMHLFTHPWKPESLWLTTTRWSITILHTRQT
jgi:hypothetical protein